MCDATCSFVLLCLGERASSPRMQYHFNWVQARPTLYRASLNSRCHGQKTWLFAAGTDGHQHRTKNSDTPNHGTCGLVCRALLVGSRDWMLNLTALVCVNMVPDLGLSQAAQMLARAGCPSGGDTIQARVWQLEAFLRNRIDFLGLGQGGVPPGGLRKRDEFSLSHDRIAVLCGHCPGNSACSECRVTCSSAARRASTARRSLRSCKR